MLHAGNCLFGLTSSKMNVPMPRDTSDISVKRKSFTNSKILYYVGKLKVLLQTLVALEMPPMQTTYFGRSTVGLVGKRFPLKATPPMRTHSSAGEISP